jgi:outer membrane immunogenic protein
MSARLPAVTGRKDRWSSDETDPAGRLRPFDLKVDGFTGGGLIGANVQYGNSVWGVEADIGVLTGSTTFGPLRTLFPDDSDIDSVATKMRWNAHARIRSGYSFGTWMPFVASGVAYAQTRATLVNTLANPPNPIRASVSLDRIGYSAGGGVDWMFHPNWIARAEYIYDRYASASFQVPVEHDSQHMALRSHILRGALMYKFGDAGTAPATGAVYKAPPAPAAGPWTGGYVGAFAGGHWSTDRWISDEISPGDDFGSLGIDVDGFTGGGLIGANLQYGRLVWGVEADIGLLTGRASFPGRPGDGDFLDSIETKMRWNAHARLRFGYDAGNWLPFIAGGVAYAGTRVTINNFDGTPPSGSIDLNRVGFSFGGGLDWRFAANWIGRVEYLHDRYGTASFGTHVDGDSHHMQLHSHIVRGALIYQFGAAPVVARN